MRSEPLKDLLKRQDDAETLILRICEEKYVGIEFDYPYEAELKLKIIYEQLEDESPNVVVAGSPPDLQKYFLNVVLGLLKRIQPHQSNFNIIFRLLLFIDHVRPADADNILRTLIEQSKFIHLTIEENKYNLHVELINIYLNLISRPDEISFMENYLTSEFSKERLLEFPNFVAVFLRFYIKFLKQDYLSALEVMIPFVIDEKKAFRLTISLNEYMRTQRSYLDLISWLATDFSKFHNKNKGTASERFLEILSAWVSNQQLVSENKCVPIVAAEIEIIKDNFDLKNAMPHLHQFCALRWDNVLEYNQMKRAFLQFLNQLDQAQYLVSDPISEDNEHIVVFIERRKSRQETADSLFSEANKTYYLEIPAKLYLEYQRQ